MIKVDAKSLCAGCTACASICPEKCIRITEDQEGFDYPEVDSSKCINCGMCEKICPVINKNESGYTPYTVVVQNKNEDIRNISSAGGVIGLIFEYVFEHGGAAYGAGFLGTTVRHIKVTSMEECIANKVFASKYVSSQVDGVFVDIERELRTNKLVCFVGLPCQVAGLRAFLRKDYYNLILIDLTCYGVPSRKLYRKYIGFIEGKYGKKVNDIQFRDKSFGYAAPTMSLTLEDGKKKSQNSDVKTYLRAFFANVSIRPSCYECAFKNVERISDFTVGDCKNIGSFYPDMDDDRGTTVLYIQSQKGEKILNELKNVEMREVPVAKIVASCGKKMTQRPKLPQNREQFFSEIDSLSYPELINKYCPADFEEKAANIVKGFLLATGLNKTKIMKRIKHR